MKMHKESIAIQRTGYIYKNSDQIEPGAFNWMVCHGYGQLGDHMLSKFSQLNSGEHRVISVEAPNRFYWEGVRGRPVCNWMTSRYRLEEIIDNNRFLNTVYSTYLNNDGKKVLLGFSQGGTTLWRYILDYRPDFDLFINYAGWVPDELDISVYTDYLADKKLVFTSGTKDHFLTAERLKKLKELTYNWDIKVNYEITDDDHRVKSDHIDYLIKKYLT